MQWIRSFGFLLWAQEVRKYGEGCKLRLQVIQCPDGLLLNCIKKCKDKKGGNKKQ
jgi:hypothetical protein